NERYPRLFLTRERGASGALYYGPYVNVKLLKTALSFMKKIFPLRTCRRMRRAVCLEYHIGQCYGPCENRISEEDYNDIVNQLKKFLDGRKDDLIVLLEKQMKKFSAERDYEKALEVKKRIQALTAIQRFHNRAGSPIFGELDELRNALNLPAVPRIIECFDISNISGRQAAGSMVKFVAGLPCKSGYRKFRIKTVKDIDDYLMIREVVRRRYSRLIEEGKELPDLVLIDGGKGHMSAAKDELCKIGLGALPVASIAKEHNHLYYEALQYPIRLSPGSGILFLIQRIRDEAHRFAIKYHRTLRRLDTFTTELRQIKGVGPDRERMLLEKFGTVGKIAEASIEELRDAGLDKKTSRSVKEHFNNLP
ncbi:MAG: helix-hairpin-helix domain-containing protein, partial [Candidatus Omnitrophota bacterium]